MYVERLVEIVGKRTREVENGGSVTLECKIKGNRTATITWSKLDDRFREIKNVGTVR